MSGMIKIERRIRYGAAVRSTSFSYPKFKASTGKAIFEFARSGVTPLNDCIDMSYSAHIEKMRVGEKYTFQLNEGKINIVLVKHDNNAQNIPDDVMTLKRYSALVSDAALTLIDSYVEAKKKLSDYKPLLDMLVPLSQNLPTVEEVFPDQIGRDPVVERGSALHVYISYKFFRCKGEEFLALVYPSMYIFDIRLRVRNPNSTGLLRFIDADTYQKYKTEDSDDDAIIHLYEFLLARVASKFIVVDSSSSPKTFSQWMESNADIVQEVIQTADLIPAIQSRTKASIKDISTAVAIMTGRPIESVPAPGGSGVQRPLKNTPEAPTEDRTARTTKPKTT